MCAMTGSIEIESLNEVASRDAGNNEQRKRRDVYEFYQHFKQRLPLSEVVEELLLLGKTAFPTLLTTLLIASKSIISMLFLGRMGNIELAGGSLAIAFANITGFSVMKGLAMAMDPICSQAYGAKRWSVLGQMYLKTFLLLVFASVPISLLWLNVEHVFAQLGQDRIITKVAKDYLVFLLPELLAQAHLHPLRSFLRTQSLTSPTTIVATCATILHLPITYLFVTYLRLGVKGIALTSVCYAFNMNAGLLIYIAMSKVALKPWVGATVISTFQGWGPLLSLAIPSLCSVCLEWWWYEIILFLGGLLSNPQSTVGAVGILIQTIGAIYVVPYSLNVSISQRVGHELGAGAALRAQRAAIIGITIGLAYGLTAFCSTFVLRSVWGKIYTNDPETLALIATALPLIGLAEVGNAPQTAACGALVGSARPKVGVRVNLTSFYLIGLPVAVLLAFKLNFGFWGLWWGLVASQYSCVVMMLCTLYQTDWKHQTRRAEELTLAAGEEDVVTNLVA
ncbi:protein DETOXIFICATION 53-like [Rhododendron vialii]|uniref:protein DETOXIFICATION 53-like n=1 Tax=Rhododendron vialii TaxID=182163 RepID=UPI00265E3E67|nr:protein DETOXIFICATION 53-like [Rhododendron vialii]